MHPIVRLLLFALLALGLHGCQTAPNANVTALDTKSLLDQASQDIIDCCNEARSQSSALHATTELVIEVLDQKYVIHVCIPKDALLLQKPKKLNSDFEPFLATKGGDVECFRRELPEEISIEALFVNYRSQMDKDEARIAFRADGKSDEFTCVLMF